MAEKDRANRPSSGLGQMNATQLTAGACIVSAGVLLMLMDGGAQLIFSAIAGTSAYLIHNCTTNDIPEDLKSKYSDEMSDLDLSDKALLTAASCLAALGVVINPWVGIPALIAALLFHMKMQAARHEAIHNLVVELNMA